MTPQFTFAGVDVYEDDRVPSGHVVLGLKEWVNVLYPPRDAVVATPPRIGTHDLEAHLL